MNRKNLFILLLLFLIHAACRSKESLPTAPTGTPVGEYMLDLSFLPDPPKRGKNEVLVKIMPKSNNKPIRSDRLSVTAVMPAMATMAEMVSEAEITQQEDGSALGQIVLGMGGTWFLEVDFTPPGAPPHQARYKVVTGSPGMTFMGSEIEGQEAAPPANRQPVAFIEPVREATGSVMISPARQQLIGVKTDTVKRRLLMKTVRTQGRVTYDERKRAEIALKFSGFIGKIFVDFVGKPIKTGQPLFTIYSQELTTSLGEYVNLTAIANDASPSATDQTGPFDSLLPLRRTALNKLLLLDITREQIDEIVRTGNIPQYLPILSPAAGIVVEKQIVQGSPVAAGQVLYRLADLSSVWVEAFIYESELSLMQIGLPVKIQPISLPNTTFDGAVSFIHPLLDSESRAGRVRIEVSNPKHQLLPEMSVNLTAQRDLGETLTLPEEAIIYAGEKKIVFVDLGEGRFVPRKVKIGQKGEGFYELIEGVSEGERVVTSGNFLIAAESRMIAGLSTFLETE